MICGPMFSGKSTALLQKIERAVYGKKTVALVRPKKDNRNYFTHSDGNDKISAFIKDKKVTLFEIDGKLSEEKAKNILDNFNTVCVDEYFMIEGCDNFVKHISVLPHSNIYFAGLLSTSENTLFPETIKILPYCDEILKLNAVCTNCGSDHASYSLFTGGKKSSVIVVGDENKYTCVCRKCYKELNGNL